MPPSLTRYDEIPYRSLPFPQTRPERLEAISRLFGLVTPPSRTARVLELGCGAGANLISLANDFPAAQFVGVDASARQIADGWNVIQAIDLRNIQLKHLDLAEIGPDFGEFDYIICHGVFSWVPPAVQTKILEILRVHLVPNGVGYISYNTYPGWHIRGIVRDMMRYHGTQFPDPATQLAQAKALVQFVADTGKLQDSRYKQLLRDELETISGAEESYLHHEHLEENNQPFYFHEFAQRLGAHGLQFLGESDFSTMVASNFAPEIADTLRRLGAHDILQMEQYLDFVRCRYFRQSLICKRNIPLNRVLEAGCVKMFRLSSRAEPVQTPVDFSGQATVEFKVPSGAGLNCRHPLTKAALLALKDAWPVPLTFPDLLAAAQRIAAEQGVSALDCADEEFLASDLLNALAAGLLEWRIDAPPYAEQLSESPVGSRLAQWQVQTGLVVTNLRGEAVTLDVLHAEVLRHLDGRRTREDLVDVLIAFLKREGNVLRRDTDNSAIMDEAEQREVLRQSLGPVLNNLLRTALLVPSSSSPAEIRTN